MEECSIDKYKKFVRQILGARIHTAMEGMQDANPPINSDGMIKVTCVDFWLKEYRRYVVHDLDNKKVQCVLHNEKV